MQHIVEEWLEEFYDSSIWRFYFNDMRIGVLDIETTGFSAKWNEFILGGLYDMQEGKIHQVMADTRAEEAELLQEFGLLLNDFDVVITYNGRNFDMPFIYQRYDRYGISIDKQKLYNLDLMNIAKSYSELKAFLPNFKQKTLENFMGLWDTRVDEIDGGKSVELYCHYESTADKTARDKILLHNNDDVRQLTRLLKVLAKCDFNKAMRNYGFPLKIHNKLFTIERSAIRNNSLQFEGLGPLDVEYTCFEYNNWPVNLNLHNGKIVGSIPIMKADALTVVDIEPAGLCNGELNMYPSCESGFLVIAENKEEKDREINHLVKETLKMIMEDVI